MTNQVRVCTDVILKMGKRLESEQRENIRLREALEFYADKENYKYEVYYIPSQEITCMILDDKGHAAHQALEVKK